jgi:hypothetical protein
MLNKLRFVRAVIDGLEPLLVAWQKGATEKAQREALSSVNSAAREIQAIINVLKRTTPMTTRSRRE